MPQRVDTETITADGTGPVVRPPTRTSGRAPRKKTTKATKATKATKTAKPKWPLDAKGRPVPTKDPDARFGKRTVTQRQRDPYYVGYEEHLATRVRQVHWRGRAEELGLSPAVINFIVGVRVAPALDHRGVHGTDLITAVKKQHPSVRNALADRGYTPHRPEAFAHLVRAAGVQILQDYTRFQREARIEPLTITTPDGDTVNLLPIAGGFFHEFMPADLMDNPALPEVGTKEREDVEEHYNKRAAYMWRIHSYGSDGSVRLRCPACDGRLRPLDLTEAANLGKIEMPGLDVPEGVTRCCAGSIITVPATSLPREFQPLPFGTTAWRKAFGRRSLVENSNSLLQTGIARQTRGFFRVFGLAKVSFLLAMTAAAINLLLYEKEWQKTRVEVLKHEGTDPSEVDDVYLDHYAEGDDPGGDVFTNLSSQAPP